MKSWELDGILVKEVGWLVVGLWPIVRLWDLCLYREWPPLGVFLRDSSPQSRKFRKKTRKTPKGYVDNRDRGLNLAPHVYQLWTLPLRHWWGTCEGGLYDCSRSTGMVCRFFSFKRNARMIWKSKFYSLRVKYICGKQIKSRRKKNVTKIKTKKSFFVYIPSMKAEFPFL